MCWFSKRWTGFLAAPDTGTARGLRDRAMLEVLYATGLRVSELIGSRIDGIDIEIGFVRCIGKGQQRTDRALRRIRRGRGRGVSSGSPGEKADELRLPEPTGRQLSRMGFWKILRDTGSRQDQEKLDASRATSFFCNASAGARRRSASGPDHARSRQYFDHGNLYTRDAGTAERDLQKLSSARMIGYDSPLRSGQSVQNVKSRGRKRRQGAAIR